MKIRLLSDLHCEGYKFIYDDKGEDVLVLAGDIHTLDRHEEILDQIPDYVRVVLVPGNHEYYRGTFERVNDYLKGLEKIYPHLKVLLNESWTFQGVEFFGGTMFTDFALFGQGDVALATHSARNGINDFRAILTYGTSDWKTTDKPLESRLWKTDDHEAQHRMFCAELRKWLAETVDLKRVVVSHFVPHPKAIHGRWVGSWMNPYFTANMEQYMGWNGLWLYGHTHDSNDFMVGDTRVVGNPRGYGNENVAGFNEVLLLEI